MLSLPLIDLLMVLNVSCCSGVVIIQTQVTMVPVNFFFSLFRLSM
jgi:hypothetical protein